MANGLDATVLRGCTRFSEVELVDQVGGIVDKYICWRRGLVVRL